MFTVACLSVALAIVVRCLWIRRMTWVCRWEVATTATVALMGIALLLTSPRVDSTIGRWLHDLTGTWQMENLIGHLCFLAGLSAFAHATVSRLSYTAAERRSFYKMAIGVSGALYIPLLTVAFIMAQDVLDEGHSLAGQEFWLQVYTVVLCGALGRLLWHLMRELLILRTDPRSQAACDIYLVSILFGFGAVAAGINMTFGTVVPVLSPATGGGLAAACIAGFALASTRSWHEKTRWMKPVAVGR